MRIAIALFLALALTVSGQFQPEPSPSFSAFEKRLDLTGEISTANASRVLRFVQVSDVHILDDDMAAPFRVEFLDPLGNPFTSAYRPHEEYTDEVFNDVISKINLLHGNDALDFVVSTGDNIDNSLENELFRFLDNIKGTVTTKGPLSGKECKPDGQGDDSDVQSSCTYLSPELIENNTELDATIPFYVAFGNHDGQLQGNVNEQMSFQEVANQYGREVLIPQEYVAMHFENALPCPAGIPGGNGSTRDGFGFEFAGDRLCDTNTDNDGYYAFSKNGVRIIVLDTVNDDFIANNAPLASAFKPESYAGYDPIGGYAEGSLDAEQYEWLLKEISDHPTEAVLIFSHHTVNSMFTNPAANACAPVGCLGTLLEAAGFITGPQIIRDLSKFTNVVAWFGGHTHQHKVELKGTTGAGFWNVETSSVIDYPQESRIIELWQTADSIFVTLEPFGHGYQKSKDLVKTDSQQDLEGQAGQSKDRQVLLSHPKSSGMMLTSQPTLAREISLSLGYAAIEALPADRTLTITASDELRAKPISGLEIEYQLKTATTNIAAGNLTTDEAGMAILETSFQTTDTHFLQLAIRDPSGTYPEKGRTFSIAIDAEEPPIKETKKSPTGIPLTAVGILLAALLVRTNDRRQE